MATDYEAHLRAQWHSRAQIICLMGIVATPAIAFADYLLSTQLGIYADAIVGIDTTLLRLVWVLLPLVLLAYTAVRSDRPEFPNIALAATCAFAMGNDLTYHLIGGGITWVHGVVYVAHLVAIPSVLPLSSRQRVAFYAANIVGTIVFLFAFNPATGLMRPTVLSVLVLLALPFIAIPSVILDRSLRQAFSLHHAAKDSHVELDHSRERILRASRSLMTSVSELEQSTGALAMVAEQARGESSRIATTSEQVSAGAQALTQQAQQSADQVRRTEGEAETIGELVQEMEQAIAEISKAVSNAISTISGLDSRVRNVMGFVADIQEIAAQTTILSLNAGIEAARAGDQGRGFGVVADQVRKLAEDTGEISTQIADTMAEIRDHMAAAVDGTGQVATQTTQFRDRFFSARNALQNIRDSVTLLEESVRASLSDANEQAGATDQISQGSARVLEISREYAQMTEEVAATSSTLSQLAIELEELLPRQ